MISTTLKDIKIQDVVSIIFQFTLPVLHLLKHGGSLRMLADYHKLNQIVAPVFAAVADVILLARVL